jgi:hypothetical protein
VNPPSSKSPYRLIVEGPDDKWTLIHLLRRHGFDWDDPSKGPPYVHEAGGITTLLSRDFLSSALKSHERLGLVLDADFPPPDRWHQLRSVLATLGIALPSTPASDGVIVSGMRPNSRLGIWLMPDNSQPGRIEEFIEKLVPTGSPTWTHARDATTQALALGAPLRVQDHIKGALHAWLAWQADPGLPFGTALFSRILEHDSPEAQRFVAWFKQCFT